MNFNLGDGESKNPRGRPKKDAGDFATSTDVFYKTLQVEEPTHGGVAKFWGKTYHEILNRERGDGWRYIQVRSSSGYLFILFERVG